MASLVEDIVSLENEADSIVAQARAEAKEMERSVVLEAEAHRRKLAEETDQRVLSYQGEMEEKYKHMVAEMENELARVLAAIDQIADETVNRQIRRIITQLSEF